MDDLDGEEQSVREASRAPNDLTVVTMTLSAQSLDWDAGRPVPLDGFNKFTMVIRR
ncbi:hypothetical protein [Sorangium sp. So ce887]|uniref:hypothetical protein n=1 Tax=Sorangium sp. So ce887 TaxID=3133324 RepID=UPI003F5EC3EA